MKKTDDDQCDEIAKHALFIVEQYERKYWTDGFGPEHFCMAALAAMSGIMRSGVMDKEFNNRFIKMVHKSLDIAYESSLTKENSNGQNN